MSDSLNANKTILLVDDEKDIRDMLSVGIESSGFDVETAENGLVALETLQKKKIDPFLAKSSLNYF